MEKHEWEEMKILMKKLEIAEKLLENTLGCNYREELHDAGLCDNHPSYCTVCYAQYVEE